MSRVYFLFQFLFLICSLALSQPIGNTYIAGTTWYDMQHPGSCGRMISVDENGYAYVAWTNGLYSDLLTRHVYYNIWKPENRNFEFQPGGIQMDASQRAGFPTITYQISGSPFIAYHAFDQPNPHSEINHYYLFNSQIPFYTGDSIEIVSIWPQVTGDINNYIHVISMELPDVQDQPARIYYSRGWPNVDEGGYIWDTFWDGSGYQLLDTVIVYGHTVAASRSYYPRIALGWLKSVTSLNGDTSRYCNDVILEFSEDGGQNWGPKFNVTQFVPSDTFRAFTDLSLLFTQNEILHAAFTTVGYYDSTGEATQPASAIWHWDDNNGIFSLIAKEWFPYPNQGRYQTLVERPSLAVDEITGYLYCVYMRYDTMVFTTEGYANADIFISVSTDNGIHWSVGTNVTRTTPEESSVPVGQSLHEREPTLAELVTDGYLHLSYVLDHEAGTCVYDDHSEGVCTLNEFIYQRIPVDSIPITPLMPQYPLHHDSSGFYAVGHHEIPIPQSIQLAAYPNPFNSTTRITFILPFNEKIELKVYDVLGRRVESLMAEPMTAGEHSLMWDASRLSSGLYFVALQTLEQKRVQKVILLK